MACDKADISYSTFRRWYKSDAEFAEQVDDCNERRTDYVESKLMERIDAGDVTATIFYLKTQGRKRGWTEKNLPQPQPQSQTTAQESEESSKKIRTRISGKKTYIVKLLKQQGKYTPELSMQVKIVAQLMVRTEILAEEIFSDGHKAVNVEISREGNSRESISPKEKLYLALTTQTQKALKALGMNTDSKDRPSSGDDEFSKFMKEFSNDNDD